MVIYSIIFYVPFLLLADTPMMPNTDESETICRVLNVNFLASGFGALF